MEITADMEQQLNIKQEEDSVLRIEKIDIKSEPLELKREMKEESTDYDFEEFLIPQVELGNEDMHNGGPAILNAAGQNQDQAFLDDDIHGNRNPENYTSVHPVFMPLKGNENAVYDQKRTTSREGTGLPCKFCGKILSTRRTLTRHVRTHLGQRPYSCDMCERSYNDKYSLTAHMRFHTGERPFTCEICSASFARKNSLFYHMHTHTNERPFACNVCNKLFSDKNYLKRHVLNHTGERPYSCDICNKTFASISHFSKHKHLHSGERAFICDICKKSFTYKCDLSRHILTHRKP